MISIKKEHTPDGDEVYMEKRGRGLFYITERLVDTMEFSESPKG
jgi:anti-sigma regulatory factor (Ser/Thr protein kinase)